ncbi:MAG TPA: peptidylprolyl isomerase [Candidatus Nitrosotenuis sp.]|nr:peptidylprolyl isomerase [Candidatus Nitrosotenuis sp.]
MFHRAAIVFGSLALLLGVAACRKEAAPGPDVWAVVNEKEIKREEVEKYFRSRFAAGDQQPSQEEALSLKLNILDELINNEILLDRAKKLGLEAGDGEVEDRFTESKSPLTEDEFQRQLKDRGLTVDDLKRDLRRQISIQKLLNREIVSKVTITDQDIADFYNQNRAQFNVAETQYRIAQIVVTPRKDPLVRNRKNDDAGSDVEAKRKIQTLYERLASGADFAQLAMDYSEDPSAANGGDLGYNPESAFRNPKQVPTELSRIILGLKPGELSNIIVSPDAYRILKLVGREPAGQRELSDPRVQQSIRETLRNRKEQLLRAAFLAVIRDESKVVNYLAQQVLESNGKLPAAEPARQ